VSDPPDQTLPPERQPPQNARSPFSKAGIFSLLILIGLLLLLFSGLFIFGLTQVNSIPAQSASTSTSTPQAKPTSKAVKTRTALPLPTQSPTLVPTISAPIYTPSNSVLPELQLPGGHYVIYEQQKGMNVVSTSGNLAEPILAPGFVYNEAVPPILTPNGQILYAGNGIWITDIFGGTPVQIASLPSGQVITSMAMSSDGKMIAWGTEPVDGTGMIVLHAGLLAAPTVVFEQSALNCPCFRIFSFLNGSGSNADSTLLLTDDRGSHEAVQYGLWSLDLNSTPAVPQSILDEDPEQGPLALESYGNALLFSTNEGAAPVPTDNSVPSDVATLSYANSLDLAALSGSPLAMGKPQVVLSEQHDLSNSANYHWVTTPSFSPDGHTLAYVEFSSDSSQPYDRHSAIYVVRLSASGSSFVATKPALVATSTARLLELGTWFNNHILTFYGDGVLYAFDINTGALTTLATPGSYARIIAVVGSGLT
jgi:hypothetical protein